MTTVLWCVLSGTRVWKAMHSAFFVLSDVSYLNENIIPVQETWMKSSSCCIPSRSWNFRWRACNQRLSWSKLRPVRRSEYGPKRQSSSSNARHWFLMTIKQFTHNNDWAFWFLNSYSIMCIVFWFEILNLCRNLIIVIIWICNMVFALWWQVVFSKWNMVSEYLWKCDVWLWQHWQASEHSKSQLVRLVPNSSNVWFMNLFLVKKKTNPHFITLGQGCADYRQHRIIEG